MKKKEIFGGLAILSFALILFTPVESNMWISFLSLGIILGVMWYMEKRRN